MKMYALRLGPDEDLRSGLEDVLDARKIQAAALVSCVGSLHTVRLRLAAATEERVFAGPFEIVSAEGTLSANGCHLHIAVADQQGKVVGGHLCYGSLVMTTAELVLIELPDHIFSRQFDSETGYKELLIREAVTGK